MKKIKYLSFLNPKLQTYSSQKKESLPYFFLKKFDDENLLKLFGNKFASELLNSNEYLTKNENAISNLANLNFFDFKVGSVTSIILNLIKAQWQIL